MEKQQKKQLKRYIFWICLALSVLLLAVMPLLASQSAEADGPQASILTATAENRDITTQIIGGGQLSSKSAKSVTIPAQIKLTKYLVGNGDSVKAGDPIARVDKVSVMTALEAVQETLDYLAEQIADESSATESDIVTAQAGGLVKVLYAQAGDSVRDVMLRHGALAVLSLDGRMAVDIQHGTGLSHGDTVRVTVPDGSEVDGWVESAVGGVLTVSIEDDGYPIGETVTVKTEGGDPLGSGELYIHSPWNASAYHGTISAVNVEEGTTVSAGRQLFRLETSGHTAQFQILTSQRQEYEKLMQELFSMYQSGVITAPCDGFVTGGDKDGAFLLAAGDTQQGWFIQLLGNEIPSDPADAPEEPSEPAEPSTPPEEPENPTDPNAPVYTVYVGQVLDENGTVALHPTVYSGIADLNTVSATVSIGGGSEVWPVAELYNKDLVTPYTGTAAVGNILFKVVDGDGNITYVFAAVAASGQPTQGGISGGMGSLGGLIGGFSGSMGGYTGNTAAAFEPYSLETLTIATVTTQEQMSLEITVDEQDISHYHTGQTADVTVEALPGQTFPAVVTAMGSTGTNTGGSSKFTVTLTLQKTGEMLPGMNASAYTDLETAESVLAIPVAALVEEGARTLVYTGYDEKNAALTGAVEVTTGLSDGEYVELLSGLDAGSTVYYAYYDTLEISNVAELSPFGF